MFMNTESRNELNEHVGAALDWAAEVADEIPELAFLTFGQSVQLGGPDLILPFVNGEWVGLLIWYSESPNGSLTEEQADFINEYFEFGMDRKYKCSIAFNGANGVIMAIKEYLADKFGSLAKGSGGLPLLLIKGKTGQHLGESR